MERDGLVAWDRLRQRYGVFAPTDLDALLSGDPDGPLSTSDLIRTGRALGVDKDESIYLPAFQFDSTGRVYASVAPLLEAFRAAGWSDFSIAIWFATPTTWLSGERPADLLPDHAAVDRLLKAARRTVQA